MHLLLYERVCDFLYSVVYGKGSLYKNRARDAIGIGNQGSARFEQSRAAVYESNGN